MATQPQSEQLQFCEPAVSFSLGAWEEYGKALMLHGKHLARQEGSRQWDIGDWLLEGLDGVQTKILRKEDFKKRALKITKYKSIKVLENLMTTARRIEESRRHDGREGRPYLSFSIHCVAAKYEDPELQDKVLEIAHKEVSLIRRHVNSQAVPLSVRDLRAHIATKQQFGELPQYEGYKPPEPKPEGRMVEILVPYTLFVQLRGWAECKFRNQNSAQMLFWCAQEYLKENRSALDAMVAAKAQEEAARNTRK